MYSIGNDEFVIFARRRRDEQSFSKTWNSAKRT
jgi:hypothetical protein